MIERESHKVEPTRVTLSYARTHFSEVVRRAEGGEDIMITKQGRDVARLIRSKALLRESRTA